MDGRHDELATKGDLAALGNELRAEIAANTNELRGEIGRAVGAAVEELSSRMRAVLKEGIDARFESLERRMGDLETRLCERMDTLEGAIRGNSTDIQKLQAEVAELRKDLERRDGRIDDLERRMDVVEKRLGIRS